MKALLYQWRYITDFCRGHLWWMSNTNTEVSVTSSVPSLLVSLVRVGIQNIVRPKRTVTVVNLCKTCHRVPLGGTGDDYKKDSVDTGYDTISSPESVFFETVVQADVRPSDEKYDLTKISSSASFCHQCRMFISLRDRVTQTDIKMSDFICESSLEKRRRFTVAVSKEQSTQTSDPQQTRSL
ncbi:hypothetical protein QAD02_000590 [Eretmocerus hayati]|uniref:Uncharacterized protein n=1 Tax=Eretmocerus hayati TaxID=131215 RepID=A0ACC2NEM0_9HYME|nr:hypothetical protein QAD02_000590 [Eretmocerus hayati]